MFLVRRRYTPVYLQLTDTDTARRAQVFPSDLSRSAPAPRSAFKTMRRLLRPAFSFGLIALAAAISARAQTLTVLHSFTGSDGANPSSVLIRDSAGNFYGTTSSGGSSSNCPLGCGTVFELVNSSGIYTEKVLYSFAGQTNGDGASPGTSLAMDAAGNLYGTTASGGASGFGTVFELVNSSGSYTEKVLYSFSFEGGWLPGGLVMDAAGNLYGTTVVGGAGGAGTVFELVNTSGSYTEKVLYSFTFIPGDGVAPNPSLVMDTTGNLYGTTLMGGSTSACDFGCGTVFELVNASGSYSEKVLYSFTGSGGDGLGPGPGLVIDAAGNLYGTTSGGGVEGGGTVFELVNSSGNYTEKVLYSFTGSGSDGAGPAAGLVMDGAGNLYGTTSTGGDNGNGTVFELVNSPSSYSVKVLHSFGSFSGDGFGPATRLMIDASGNLYGTTTYGGANDHGTVFEVNPTATAPEVALSPSNMYFVDQKVSTTSAAQTATVTNSGNAELIFGAAAVTLSGANPADFALSTDNCAGATVAPSATCSVSVTFTPAALGNASATLNFADNATNGPQTVSLTGRGVSLGVANFSTYSLTFSNQIVGTHSAPQTVTLSNTGTGPLGITGVATDNGDFSENNNCPASLSAGASCTINVTFTPSAPGSDSGTLSVTDDAAGSPQNLLLSGTGTVVGDFTLGMASGSPSSATVTAGGSATYSLTLAPQGGFNQTVLLGCEGAPFLSICTLSPASVTLDGTNAATVKVTVITIASTIVLPRTLSPPVSGGWPAVLLGTVALLGLAALSKVRSRRGGTRPARLAVIGSLTGLLLFAALASSCGGGGFLSLLPKLPGTLPGTYTLTVTGTCGNLTHSTTLTLTVQ